METYMACHLCNNSKNRFYGRKTGLTTKLALSNGKTGFSNKTLIIKLKIQFLSVKQVLPFDNDSIIRKQSKIRFYSWKYSFYGWKYGFIVENTVVQ